MVTGSLLRALPGVPSSPIKRGVPSSRLRMPGNAAAISSQSQVGSRTGPFWGWQGAVGSEPGLPMTSLSECFPSPEVFCCQAVSQRGKFLLAFSPYAVWSSLFLLLAENNLQPDRAPRTEQAKQAITAQRVINPAHSLRENVYFKGRCYISEYFHSYQGINLCASWGVS